jgi:hypothetical protein
MNPRHACPACRWLVAGKAARASICSHCEGEASHPFMTSQGRPSECLKVGPLCESGAGGSLRLKGVFSAKCDPRSLFQPFDGAVLGGSRRGLRLQRCLQLVEAEIGCVPNRRQPRSSDSRRDRVCRKVTRSREDSSDGERFQSSTPLLDRGCLSGRQSRLRADSPDHGSNDDQPGADHRDAHRRRSAGATRDRRHRRSRRCLDGQRRPHHPLAGRRAKRQQRAWRCHACGRIRDWVDRRHATRGDTGCSHPRGEWRLGRQPNRCVLTRIQLASQWNGKRTRQRQSGQLLPRQRRRLRRSRRARFV